jgi:hypothetical protein
LNLKNSSNISEICEEYNTTILPLIALVESRTQKFPIPILNEIRALFGHISKCYRPNLDEDNIRHELKRARSHSKRIILDCYKILVMTIDEELVKFLSNGGDSISLIDNGQFYSEFALEQHAAAQLVKSAKIQESIEPSASFSLWDQAFNAYRDLDKKRLDALPKLVNLDRFDKKRSTKKVLLGIMLSIIFMVLGAILSNVVRVNYFDDNPVQPEVHASPQDR